MRLPYWFPLMKTHPFMGAAVLLAGALLVFLIRSVVRRSRVGARLDSTLGLIGTSFLIGALSSLGRGGLDGYVFRVAFAIFVAACAIGLVRLALVLFVDFYLRERKGAAVSTIFREVASVVTYFVIILLVLRSALDINLASLIATSAVLTAILGLALQDVLSNVISGLVLELEAPVGQGDWIRVGAFEGQVVETGWRTTKIRTRVNEVVTLPNGYVSKEPLVNYSRPDPRHGDTLRFQVGYEVPPSTVKEAVLAVLGGDPRVLPDPSPEVRTAVFAESGIDYVIRYWLDDFGSLDQIRDSIMTRLWYALRRAGARIPFPARDLFVHQAAPPPEPERRDVAETLAQVPMLAPLGEMNLRTLAGRVRRATYGAGEVIVREGAPGDSFYVVERGGVRVEIDAAGGAARQIAALGAGEFFGEMSLLAGEPRSATVLAEEDTAVIEVDRAAFHDVVAGSPAVLEPISQIAAHRLEAQREHRKAVDAMPPFASDPEAQRLLQRVRAFFGV